jgi:hypothetical protein
MARASWSRAGNPRFGLRLYGRLRDPLLAALLFLRTFLRDSWTTTPMLRIYNIIVATSAALH